VLQVAQLDCRVMFRSIDSVQIAKDVEVTYLAGDLKVSEKVRKGVYKREHFESLEDDSLYLRYPGDRDVVWKREGFEMVRVGTAASRAGPFLTDDQVVYVKEVRVSMPSLVYGKAVHWADTVHASAYVVFKDGVRDEAAGEPRVACIGWESARELCGVKKRWTTCMAYRIPGLGGERGPWWKVTSSSQWGWLMRKSQTLLGTSPAE
jgi:hypothetical protein